MGREYSLTRGRNARWPTQVSPVVEKAELGARVQASTRCGACAVGAVSCEENGHENFGRGCRDVGGCLRWLASPAGARDRESLVVCRRAYLTRGRADCRTRFGNMLEQYHSRDGRVGASDSRGKTYAQFIAV